jgi:NADPH:quinone reductase and related Zn-dependent oxidoreductases
MKSIKITNTGGPEVLKLEDITLEKPGEGEIQIEHVSIGLNYRDTYHRSGLYPLKFQLYE